MKTSNISQDRLVIGETVSRCGNGDESKFKTQQWLSSKVENRGISLMSCVMCNETPPTPYTISNLVFNPCRRLKMSRCQAEVI